MNAVRPAFLNNRLQSGVSTPLVSKPLVWAAVCLFHLAATLTPSAAQRLDHLQSVGGFERPTATHFSSSGGFVYVANAGQADNGHTLGGGYLSLLRRHTDGQFGVLEDRWVEGLSTPVALGELPVTIGLVPSGSLAVLSGSALAFYPGGRQATAHEDLFIGVVFLHPVTGEERGRISMGPGSALAEKLGHPVLGPTSLAINSRGYMFIADAGGGGGVLQPPVNGRQGVILLPPETLEALLSDAIDRADPRFSPTPVTPSSLYWEESTRSLLMSTASQTFRPTSGLFRIPEGDFSGRVALETVVGERPPMGHIVSLPGQVRLIVMKSGEMVVPRNRRNTRVVRIRPERTFALPGQMHWMEGPSGEHFVVIPERGGGGTGGHQIHFYRFTR